MKILTKFQFFIPLVFSFSFSFSFSIANAKSESHIRDTFVSSGSKKILYKYCGDCHSSQKKVLPYASMKEPEIRALKWFWEHSPSGHRSLGLQALDLDEQKDGLPFDLNGIKSDTLALQSLLDSIVSKRMPLLSYSLIYSFMNCRAPEYYIPMEGQVIECLPFSPSKGEVEIIENWVNSSVEKINREEKKASKLVELNAISTLSSCVGCHGSSSNFDLSFIGKEGGLDKLYLNTKMLDKVISVIESEYMPIGNYSDEERQKFIDSIQNWINEKEK